ncbi:MAG: tRNA-dihydrouridine synthase [Coxiellaceae bacterium]|nr:tRNA-dihydrouridine synthase [Coxiellaceae bacterium]
MKIGQLNLQSSLIQAPLAGYSCAPMRVLAEQWGQPGFCCTEMLSAKHIYSGAKQKPRYQYKDPSEGLLCVQLSGSDAEHVVPAIATVTGWGADLIDLNCGCPMPKIRKKTCGSQLLQQPECLYRLVAAMKQASNVPVMIKIRVDGRSGDRFNHEVAHAVEQGGADVISVHGRHWTERYDVECSLDDIAEIKSHISIPVIGNGDVCDALSAKRLVDHTQCDGVMIARAAVGQPWLFAQIKAELKGEAFKLPTLAERGEMLLQHVRGLIALETEKPALLQSRKLAKYYARGDLPSEQLMPFFNVCRYDELNNLVIRYFLTGL